MVYVLWALAAVGFLFIAAQVAEGGGPPLVAHPSDQQNRQDDRRVDHRSRRPQRLK